MLRATLALVFLFTLSACDSTVDPASRLDPLSQSLLRATGTVPSFGGVELETGDAMETLGPVVIVYTLGDVAAAQAAVVPIFRGTGARVEVRSRPAQGRGSESLKEQASATLNGISTADYDETTGYVRVGVRDAEAVRQTIRAIRASTLPESEIIVQVELPFIAY